MIGSRSAIVGLIGLCGGVVVLGTTMAVEQDRHTASQGARQEAIRAVTAACPELFTGKKRQTWVTMASIPGLSGQQDSGSYTLTTAGERKPDGAVEKVGGSAEVTGFPAEPTHATVTALEGLAPGSVAARTSEDREGSGKGLSSAECTRPSSKLWLVGGGTKRGQRGRLILVNPTDSGAVVDLDIYGPDGKINATGTDGIPVEAHDREEVQLDAVLPGAEALAVRVKTQVGLISGFIAEEQMRDLTPLGTEIVGDAGSPAKRLVITGLPLGTGERQIVFFAPGRGGNIRLRALTDKGPVDLVEGQDVQIRAGRVRVLDLTKELDGKAASIEAISDVPILAAASMQTTESELDSAARRTAVAEAELALRKTTKADARARATQRLSDVKAANADTGGDIVWFAARPRLRQSGAATGLLPQTKAKVSVAALGGDVDVRVSVIGSKQDPGELGLQHEATVAADTSREFRLHSGSKTTYSVVVERVGGPGRLYASHQQSGPGRAITGYSLAKLAQRVAVPAAEAVYGIPN